MFPEIVVKTVHLILWPIFRGFFKFFAGFSIKGTKNFKKIGSSFLIAANHTSYLDPFIVGVTLPFRPRYFPFYTMTGDSLMKRFALKFFIKLLGGFPAYKGKGLEHSSRLPIKILKNQGRVLIFPEGKRRKALGRPRKPRRGIAYIAAKTDAWIIPMNIKGHFRKKIWDWFLFRVKLEVAVGSPFKIRDIYPGKSLKTKKELTQAANLVMGRIRTLQ